MMSCATHLVFRSLRSWSPEYFASTASGFIHLVLMVGGKGGTDIGGKAVSQRQRSPVGTEPMTRSSEPTCDLSATSATSALSIMHNGNSKCVTQKLGHRLKRHNETVTPMVIQFATAEPLP
jgi:hypothetical protein